MGKKEMEIKGDGDKRRWGQRELANCGKICIFARVWHIGLSYLHLAEYSRQADWIVYGTWT